MKGGVFNEQKFQDQRQESKERNYLPNNYVATQNRHNISNLDLSGGYFRAMRETGGGTQSPLEINAEEPT